MSTASSPLATSPQTDVARAPRVCLNCKKKKKRCDKALPACTRCVESLTTCQHEEDLVTDGPVTPIYSLYSGGLSPLGNPGPVLRHSSQSWGNSSLVGSIRTAVDVHSLAFRSMMEIVVDRQGIEQVVSSYFAAAHTWVTIVDRPSLESQLELDSIWQSPPSAETCILILCMSLMTRPSVALPNSPMSDTTYHTVKALFGLIQSNGEVLKNVSLQAELLVALYEYSNAMPQQAYFSVGRCLQMSRMLGWHNKLFWDEERRRNFPSDLKLASTLWWALVQIDVLVSAGYSEQKYPMHTANLNLGFEIPLPKDFDKYIPAAFLGQTFADGPLYSIDAMPLPEATSAWCLSHAMQQLYHPTPTDNQQQLSDAIISHTVGLNGVDGEGLWVNGERSGAVAAGLIALMKLHAPGLLHGTVTPPGTPSPAEKVRFAVEYIHNVTLKVDRYRILLAQGRVAPSWAFAMVYASILLIKHGDGALGDVLWLQKVNNLKSLLEIYAGRWKIAGVYVKQITIALNSRLATFAS